MPILKTEMAKRLTRWMLPHTAPAPLQLEHPVQEVLAAAADEIERLDAQLNAFERIDTGLLCRAFGVSVAEAKRATETIGFMYRQRADDPRKDANP